MRLIKADMSKKNKKRWHAMFVKKYGWFFLPHQDENGEHKLNLGS